MRLILSLFPGIGLLDMAFEEQGFCVVRGPDLLWGGDVKRFHPPAGKFDGVIGGPPCQAFSPLRHITKANGYAVAPDLIPEFERVTAEAGSDWFIMENVRNAPEPAIPNYIVYSEMLREVWVGGKTSRLRRFSFGSRNGYRLGLETAALHSPDPERAVTGGGRDRSTGYGDLRRQLKPGLGGRLPKEGTARPIEETLAAVGLSPEWLPRKHPFTKVGLQQMLGNGVPLPMGRAVAKAVAIAVQSSQNAG